MGTLGSLKQAAMGHRWLLASLRTPTSQVQCEPSFHEAWMDLADSGEFGWFDTINYTSGRYEIEDGGFVIIDPATTLVGYQSLGAEQSTVIEAFGRLHGTEISGERIDVRVVDARLVLSLAHTALTFRRAGRIPNA